MFYNQEQVGFSKCGIFTIFCSAALHTGLISEQHMFRILRFLLFPFALIYGLVVIIRNTCYNSGFFRSAKFSMPVICVGNLNMGGTGKTPHTAYIVQLLMDRYHVATLSRGFGRKERGFKIADGDSTAREIGDEPLQYYRKFGSRVTVAVEADRVLGVMDLCTERPETNLVVLDDAFQHRAIHAGLNILITAYDDPFFNDFILPVGNLREFRRGKKRADIIVVSKCPDNTSFDKTSFTRAIEPLPHQQVFFSYVRYGSWVALNDAPAVDFTKPFKVVLVTGIANPGPLKNHLAEKHEIVHHFNFRDHHDFTASDITGIHNLFDKFVTSQTVVLTTEKDAMRLMDKRFDEMLKKYPWYYQEIEVEIDDKEKFDQLILSYAEKDH